jgi:hypothetical protein
MHGHMNVKFCWTVWPWRWRHKDPSKRSVYIYQYIWCHIFSQVAVWTLYRHITKNSNVCFLLFIQSLHANPQYCACYDPLDYKPRCTDGEDIARTRRSCITIYSGSCGGLRPRTPVSRHQSSRPTCCLLYCPEEERVPGNIRTYIPDYTRRCSKYRDFHIVFSALTLSIFFSTSRLRDEVAVVPKNHT